ncbi:MAG TPA: hypothetical protein VMV71_01180 [Candidatus Paceibacterota bacterium]|nr:hypothetical protein [Candidatus Paceibacterota bacterium]
MIKGGKGGGNTKTGLNFEKRVNILTLLKGKKGYEINGNSIFYEGEKVAESFKKNALYKYLESRGLDYRKYLSRRLLPDEAIYVIVNNTFFIVEIKFQAGSGSVDEKLQTCDFKRKQYAKLMAPLNIEVEYIYILSDWFRDPGYKDVLDYVISVGCQYYFQYLPLQKLGLPVPK